MSTMRVYRQQGADIAALQQRRIARFDNTGKSGTGIGYGENFRPHDKAWIDAIARNMNVAQFTEAPVYQPARRAIATTNLMVRELPTTDPSFYDHRLAGEGYPFDNLQPLRRAAGHAAVCARHERRRRMRTCRRPMCRAAREATASAWRASVSSIAGAPLARNRWAP